MTSIQVQRHFSLTHWCFTPCGRELGSPVPWSSTQRSQRPWTSYKELFYIHGASSRLMHINGCTATKVKTLQFTVPPAVTFGLKFKHGPSCYPILSQVSTFSVDYVRTNNNIKLHSTEINCQFSKKDFTFFPLMRIYLPHKIYMLELEKKTNTVTFLQSKIHHASFK